jgi:hypothetical protein
MIQLKKRSFFTYFKIPNFLEVKWQTMERLVYFRFEDTHYNYSGPDEPEDPTLVLTRGELASHPKSLLTIMTTETWAEQWDESSGTVSTNPLVMYPMSSPVADIWSNVAVELISRIYKLSPETPDVRVQLPKSGLLLEDALAIMDYYGLPAKEPTDVDFSGCDYVVSTRAKLFLKHRRNVYRARDYIRDGIFAVPRNISYFMFTERTHDIDYINEHNIHKFFRLGRCDTVFVDYCRDNVSFFECEEHFDWKEDRRMRNLLLTILREPEYGLEAGYIQNMDLSTFWPKDEPCSTKMEDHCFVDVRRNHKKEEMCALWVRAPVYLPEQEG